MTTAQRIKARLREGAATVREMALDGVSIKVIEEHMRLMLARGEIKVSGTRATGRRGPRPFIYQRSDL